ncbi:MAG: M15 family metallopeptidase [Lachnospiraceae bacterium]|nr:M15 family metallopeptidase [Lachnospiraceae bacterium]
MMNIRGKKAAAWMLLTGIIFTSLFSDTAMILAAPTVSENQIAQDVTVQVSDNQIEINTEETADPKGTSDTEDAVKNPAATPVASEGAAVSDNDTQNKPLTVDKVTGVSVTSKTYTSLEIKFAALYGPAGYEIYRGTSKNSMSMIKELAKTQTSYVDTGLTTGTTYYYKVRAYAVDAAGKKVYGAFSDISAAIPQLTVPVITSAKSTNYNKIKITYKRVTEANGYVIYRSTKKNSGFKKIATIKKGKTVTYTDKKRTTGKTYYYKVRAYRKVNGKRVYSDYSAVVAAKASLKKPKIRTVTVESADTALVKWKKVTGASGYYVYRSTKKDGKYKKAAHIKNGAATEAYVDGQENGKTYFYKIRAYRKVKGKKKYSPYSGILSATFNRLASGDETYQQKAQRIFGLDYYKKYGSKEEAELHMKTIKIQVWDFAADGVTKVTKTRTLTVHKNIADTVQQIFKEIYEGKEKFPIKNVGGYSWRGDTSRSEHCCGLAIDINWEENYLIDNGVIISGKLYQPGVNPYSIPTDGEVAKIMKKYGFSQGIWGNRCDYMHFSYFGT